MYNKLYNNDNNNKEVILTLAPKLLVKDTLSKTIDFTQLKQPANPTFARLFINSDNLFPNTKNIFKVQVKVLKTSKRSY
jgi:hypothetical protein